MVDPFQGSDIPLSEDILKKPVDFVKTWQEWAADNREQVIRHIQAFSTTSVLTVFTVPNRNTFFLTGFNFHYLIPAAFGSSAFISTVRITNPISIMAVLGNNSAKELTSGAIAQDFTMPIKLEEGTSITLQNSSTGITSEVTIFGFLIPKKISP